MGHDNLGSSAKDTQQDNVEVLGDSSLGIGLSSTHRRLQDNAAPGSSQKAEQASKKVRC